MNGAIVKPEHEDIGLMIIPEQNHPNACLFKNFIQVLRETVDHLVIHHKDGLNEFTLDDLI